jgi:hypothetical protein
MASKLNHVAPQCLALVLCDAVIEDMRSRNKSLINMFNGILSNQVPVRHDKMCAFAAFTGGRGPVPIALRLCYDLDYEKDLLRLGGVVDFPVDNPQAVVDLVFEVHGFVFPKFGQYTFEVICDDVPIMARRFTISAKSSAPQEEETKEEELESE